MIGTEKLIKFGKKGQIVLAAILRDDVFVALIETRNSVTARCERDLFVIGMSDLDIFTSMRFGRWRVREL